mgnify:CR=1 FL=1
MVQSSIWEIKAQGCFMQTQFQTNFINNMNMQTCMNSNRFKASKHSLVSPLIQKQVETMDHYKVMDMHAPFYHEINSQLNNSNMQAWNELYINR